MTNICVECKHHAGEVVISGCLLEGHFCMYPAFQRRHRVTGEPVYMECSYARSASISCGPRGDFYEPREEDTK